MCLGFLSDPLWGIQGRARRSQRELQRQKGFTWNAAILVVVSARYSNGWIQGGAKKGRGRASPLTKSSFRPNVHSNILMYCRQHYRHMHLFESRHCGCLLNFLNIQSIRPRTAASPSIQSVSHITSRHGDNPKKGCSNDVHMLRQA